MHIFLTILISETTKKQEQEVKFKHPHSIEAIVEQQPVPTTSLATAASSLATASLPPPPPPPLIYSGPCPTYINPLLLNLFYTNRSCATSALDLSSKDKWIKKERRSNSTLFWNNLLERLVRKWKRARKRLKRKSATSGNLAELHWF